MPRPSEGIETRHTRSCRSHDGGRCSCTPTFRAYAPTGERGSKARRSFPTLAAAKSWRRDALQASERGRLARPSNLTVREAGEELLAGMETGAIRNRSGDRYKAAVVASYRSSLEAHVFPRLARGD
jgi:hypothetical protein